MSQNKTPVIHSIIFGVKQSAIVFDFQSFMTDQTLVLLYEL